MPIIVIIVFNDFNDLKPAMAQKKRKKDYLVPSEVAKLLMVEPASIRLIAESGELRSSRSPGGHRRFRYEDVRQYAIKNGLSLASAENDKTRILIIDDDKRLADFLKELIESRSDKVQVMVVYNGFEAGLYAGTFLPQVVLLDLMMPGLNGFEVCERLMKDPSTKMTRVIAMTGYYTDEVAERVIAAGAETCLSKPFDNDELVKLIGIDIEQNVSN